MSMPAAINSGVWCAARRCLCLRGWRVCLLVLFWGARSDGIQGFPRGLLWKPFLHAAVSHGEHSLVKADGEKGGARCLGGSQAFILMDRAWQRHWLSASHTWLELSTAANLLDLEILSSYIWNLSVGTSRDQSLHPCKQLGFAGSLGCEAERQPCCMGTAPRVLPFGKASLRGAGEPCLPCAALLPGLSECSEVLLRAVGLTNGFEILRDRRSVVSQECELTGYAGSCQNRNKNS